MYHLLSLAHSVQAVVVTRPLCASEDLKRLSVEGDYIYDLLQDKLE